MCNPATAVDYIRKFIEDHKQEIEKRKADLTEGRSKDAYVPDFVSIESGGFL